MHSQEPKNKTSWATLPRPPLIALIVAAIGFGIGLSPIAGIAIACVTAGLFGLALIWVGARYWRNIDTA